MDEKDEKRKKPKQAIALEYDPSEDAPKVIASGTGVLAEKIIEKAKEAAVPVHRDDKLADTLSRLEIGEMIPPELYEVVAEILVFVDAMDNIKAKVMDHPEKRFRDPWETMDKVIHSLFQYFSIENEEDIHIFEDSFLSILHLYLIPQGLRNRDESIKFLIRGLVLQMVE